MGNAGMSRIHRLTNRAERLDTIAGFLVGVSLVNAPVMVAGALLISSAPWLLPVTMAIAVGVIGAALVVKWKARKILRELGVDY